MAAVWVRWLGHPEASRTVGGADGGIDVEAPGALAQVKFYASSPIGRPDIQRLFGADEGEGRDLFFFSSSGYTRQAIECADRIGVALFRLMAWGDVIAENKVARVAYGQAEAAHRGVEWVDPEVVRAEAAALAREQAEVARRRAEAARAQAATQAWVDVWATRAAWVFFVVGFVVVALVAPSIALGPNILMSIPFGLVGYWVTDRCLGWLFDG